MADLGGKHSLKARRAPVVMGALMGPMMLWMVHGQLTGEATSGAALIVFVAAHLIVLLIAAGAVVFAVRLSPKVRDRMARLHRPSLQHFVTMLISAAIAALIVHLTIHGLR